MSAVVVAVYPAPGASFVKGLQKQALRGVVQVRAVARWLDCRSLLCACRAYETASQKINSVVRRIVFVATASTKN